MRSRIRDADLGSGEHVAVGLHPDLQSVPGSLVAERGDVGEIGLSLLVGRGIAGVGVHDLHSQRRGDIDGPGEPGRALICLQLRMATEANRLQTKVRELVSDAVDLPVRRRIGIDMLEPSLDGPDLAGVISSLGKAFQRLVNRVRREDDCRTENRTLHRGSFPQVQVQARA